jgi:acyl carrier protein
MMRDETRDLTPAAIADRTRTYVRDNFLYMRPDWPLHDDAPLLGGGVIDSVSVIELVEFLQREFACTIVEDEITEANLGSLEAIARFVHAKRNGRGSNVRPHQAA